jgi:hypothetical protein
MERKKSQGSEFRKTAVDDKITKMRELNEKEEMLGKIVLQKVKKHFQN